MKHALNGLAVLAIALGGLIPAAASASSQRITHTVTTDAYPMQTAGAREVLDWVAQRVKPTFAQGWQRTGGTAGVLRRRRVCTLGRIDSRKAAGAGHSR